MEDIYCGPQWVLAIGGRLALLLRLRASVRFGKGHVCGLVL